VRLLELMTSRHSSIDLCVFRGGIPHPRSLADEMSRGLSPRDAKLKTIPTRGGGSMIDEDEDDDDYTIDLDR
jgi:hypothetical protein